MKKLLLFAALFCALSTHAVKYNQSDFKKCYGLKSAELRKLVKSGSIEKTAHYHKAQKFYLYELKDNSIKQIDRIKNLDYFDENRKPLIKKREN